MSEGPGGPQGATAGGTLAMRMLSQQAMVASQMKRAANDKAIAQMLASKKSGPPAARLGDEIQHKSFLGALAGAVLGAIVTIAEGCLIMAACATGPYALVLVPALMYASYKASDYVEEKQNQLESWINSFCDTDGAINTGSENVKINGKPAARAAVTLPPPPPPGAIPEVPQGEPSWGDIATDLLESAAEKAVPLAKAWGNAVITLTDSNAGFMDRVSAGASLLFPAGPVLMEFATMVGGRGEIKKDVDFPEAGEDTALCDKENKPPRIAQGSSNVFINNQPAARQGDKLECSAAIVGGSPDVFIGGEQVTYLDIQPEFPPWQRMILGGITIASYLLPPAGLLGKLKNLARLGKLGNLLGKSGKLLGAKLGALLGKTGKSLKSIANKVIRWVTDPVDPVTGAYCDERTDFTLGQTLPLSFTRFHSSVLPLHGLTGVGWSDSWSEYAWVREQGNRVDIISLGATLNFAFDGESDTAVNPYHAQYILRRRDDYLELFDRDALSSRFFYDAFPGMRLRHPVTDDTSDDRLAHSPGDRMYMLGGMSDTASNRITFERDSQYRITGVSHTDGIRLKLTYHASGYLKAIHRTDNGIQTLATYEQDARGRLTEADARLDYHLFYEYDAADRIIRWSDNDQTWSRFTYDAQGRCVNVTGAEGYYNATLDYGDGCTTVTDGKGIHRYYYDPDGNILREEAPDGSTTTYEWDEFHHLLARHSPAGRVEKFEYNAAHGQLSRYTAADGAEWLYRYDERGLFSNITDPAGQTWTQLCDERGLPVSLVSPQGEETRLAYTAQGLLSGIFRQDERRLGIEYDHHNRPETLTDVMGREHHTEYSGHDLPVKMRGPGGQSVRLQWQQHHKLSGIERAGTGAEGFRYDRHGNLLAYTDGNGVVWTMEYGPFDLPVARTDGEGHRWQYRYDKDTLQLTEVINPQGESYLYVLDNCGRVTEERDWGGVVWRYRYDADGLCTARVNGLEETILYSRDAAGRLAEIITPEGKTQYAYDKSGRLTGIFSPDGISQRTGYDERGRVNVTTQGRRAIEYHHPDEHTVIRCILPPEDERDRHPDESLLKTTYRYNAAGELTEIILPGDETLTFSRDEAGREVLRHSNRGFACEQGWNAAGQPVSQRAGFFPAEATWGGLVPSLVREYRYDSAGTFSTAVRQKSRWIIGIVFQGFKTHKWTSSLTLNYFLWRDRKGAISNFVSFLAMLVMLQLLLLLAYESLWPNAWHFLSIFSGSAWLMTLLWLNFGLMVNRIVQRVIFVTGYYGLTQGLLSVLRLFWGNLINFMANWRALKQVLQHGDPRRVAWDKTTHDFPSVTGDTRSLRPLGQILLENQVITEEQLDTALRNRVEGLRLGGSMLMQGLISAEQLAQALAEQNGVAWESIDAWQIPSSLIAEMPASVALHYAVLPLRLENDELIVGSEDGIDPVSLAALTRKVGRKVRYVIVLRGQIVTGLRHWYARRRGHDPRAMLYNAVQHQWLTEQQTGEIWRQYVPHQFLFAEILTTLGHINRSAINVWLLRHERSSLPLGKFLVTEGVISQETLDRVLTIQRELQVSMQSLLLKAGLNTEQVAQLESENEGE
ncbi:TPA: phage adsorption protein NrfB [Escherichia coli]|nr:phage adsorption protein NrfB [Escherichia coli]HAV9121712.1 phage adsorption protein NrfB [Escherichia coli]HCN9511893.1 phage adsorption protein NrfB [Escherichia coli]HDS4457729.1 phage adsorption protein NrfB [Escherichia coli]